MTEGKNWFLKNLRSALIAYLFTNKQTIFTVITKPGKSKIMICQVT